MPNYLDKYRALFEGLEKNTRTFRSHLSVIREHFRAVEMMLVETGLGVYTWVEISEAEGVHLGYLLFDSLTATGERQGPGHLSILSDYYSFDMRDPTIPPQATLFRIESAPYEVLVPAYSVLPSLIERYLSDVATLLGDSAILERRINEFRDFNLTEPPSLS